MKISQVILKNFKRFTHIEIRDIPETSKLVLLVGTNGSGKSSIFDAFNIVNASLRLDVKDESKVFEDYYEKDTAKEAFVNIVFHNGQQADISSRSKKYNATGLLDNTFYGRTSFRQVPRLTRKNTGVYPFKLEKDSDRPKYFIDKDDRFENDIEKLTESVLKDVFGPDKNTSEIKNKYITPINNAFINIFSSDDNQQLELESLMPPLDGNTAQIIFKKGESKFKYDYLSAGEKEVVNILLNLLSRKNLYENSIIFLDEIDLHLNTSLQYKLLKEISENWIPETSQLWVASHSLGFIDYAQNSKHACVIDLDNLDFDHKQVLIPTLNEDIDVYEVAVSKQMLGKLFDGLDIYFVENKDNEYYSIAEVDKAVFVPELNKNAVYHKVRTSDFKGVVDRDFLTDEEIKLIENEYDGLKVLKLYSIESYLFHPENVAEYKANISSDFDKKAYIDMICESKEASGDNVALSLQNNRASYPFFQEPDQSSDLANNFKIKKENRDQCAVILKRHH